MTRLIFVLAASWMVGCAPCAVSPPQTFQGEPILSFSDSEVVLDTIDFPGLPAVWFTSHKGTINLAVFQANTGQPYLTLGDNDSDGVFDMLTYSSLSADGELLVEVEDYGMDGQPDLILNLEKHSASVFYDGIWREVRGVATRRVTVEIDGEIRLLKDVLAEIRRRPF